MIWFIFDLKYEHCTYNEENKMNGTYICDFVKYESVQYCVQIESKRCKMMFIDKNNLVGMYDCPCESEIQL